jgi:hypothetical protein
MKMRVAEGGWHTFENILDNRTYRIIIHFDGLVKPLLAHTEWLLAYDLHHSAVG